MDKRRITKKDKKSSKKAKRESSEGELEIFYEDQEVKREKHDMMKFEGAEEMIPKEEDEAEQEDNPEDDQVQRSLRRMKQMYPGFE